MFKRRNEKFEKKEEEDAYESRYLLLPLMELMSARSQCTNGNLDNRYEKSPISSRISSNSCHDEEYKEIPDDDQTTRIKSRTHTAIRSFDNLFEYYCKRFTMFNVTRIIGSMSKSEFILSNRSVI